MFEIMAGAAFIFGAGAGTIGNSPIASAGAFVCAGLCAVAAAISQTKK